MATQMYGPPAQDTAGVLRRVSEKLSELIEVGPARGNGLEHSGHCPAKGGTVFLAPSQ